MLGLVSAGCAGRAGAGPDPQVSLPASIDGTEVAGMAERELEAENAGMAGGQLRCPDLELRVGASVRCVRTVQLAGGRVVKVRGTVAVTSLASGGRLHVAMDESPEEFGVAGGHVAADVRRRYHGRATGVRCPYLPGRVGATVTCRLTVSGDRRAVRVTVTAVDAADYRTTYTIDDGDSAS